MRSVPQIFILLKGKCYLYKPTCRSGFYTRLGERPLGYLSNVVCHVNEKCVQLCCLSNFLDEVLLLGDFLDKALFLFDEIL